MLLKGPMGNHEYEYAGVPPDAVAVAIASQAPEHDGVVAVKVTDRAGGEVTKTVVVATGLFLVKEVSVDFVVSLVEPLSVVFVVLLHAANKRLDIAIPSIIFFISFLFKNSE